MESTGTWAPHGSPGTGTRVQPEKLWTVSPNVAQSKEGTWGHGKGAAELHLDSVPPTTSSRLGSGREGAATRLQG